jgi:hypothetical protein
MQKNVRRSTANRLANTAADETESISYFEWATVPSICRTRRRVIGGVDRRRERQPNVSGCTVLRFRMASPFGRTPASIHFSMSANACWQSFDGK